MTKEEYIEYRKLNKLDLIAYEYFCEKSTVSMDLQTFVTYFTMYELQSRVVEGLINYLDGKYNVTLVLSKDSSQLLNII